MANAHILVVANDSTLVEHIESRLKSLGYTISVAVPSGGEAIQKAAETRPDLALVDIILEGDTDGVEVAEQMRDHFNIPVVYLTAYVDEALLQRTKITEPFGYILKPVDERRLHLNIEIALYRHEMERKFKEREQWLSTILKSIGEAVIATDKNGFVKFMNSVAETLTGWKQDEAFGKDLAEVFNVITEETDVLTRGHVMKALQEGIIADIAEHTMLLASGGKETPIDYSAASIRDDKQNITGVVLVFRDIAERKQGEEKLRQTAAALQNQARILQSIFDSIGDGVIVADEGGKFLLFNPDAERILGIGATDTTPEEWSDKYGIVSPNTGMPFPTDELPLVRAIRGKATDEFEMFIRNPKVPDGAYISASGRPLKDESGVLRGGVVVFRDVTERKRAEEALAQAYTQGRLEVVDALLHNIGNAINSVTIGIGTIHEDAANDRLTQHLLALANAIKAHQDDFSDYVKSHPQGQKVAPFIIALAEDFMQRDEKLAKTVSRVWDRAEHIADIVRMQKAFGRRSVDRKDINLKKTINDAITVLQDSIRKRGIEIYIDCDNGPKEIRIQESQFHQMLVNLVKNSIEAIDELAASRLAKQHPMQQIGPSGPPFIKIRCEVESDSLILEMTDTGMGIEKDKLEVILEPGYTTKEFGSGLGLHSIVSFVIGCGGKIYPLSDGIGNGATMRVVLPLSSVTPENTVFHKEKSYGIQK